MMKLNPFSILDFRKGVIRKATVADSLVPAGSASHSLNVNYNDIIGKASVRPGTVKLGDSVVTSSKTPLGLTEFRTAGGSTNLVLAVYSGASNASIYYYNGSWNTSGVTNLSNTAKCRFATIANRSFIANGTDAMNSSADGNTWATTDCITTDSVVPSLLIRAKSRLLASGDKATAANRNRSRVWFSSVVDSSGATGAITWDTSATGNWIDVNPDDGDEVTAFADTSAVTLVFKNYYTYRLFSITKTVDPDPLFNFGAPSQEAVTNCQGIIYFFTGKDIRRTNGSDTSEKISRFVQDWLEAIPQANWANVSAGNDGTNVYFSLGAVTVPTSGDDTTTYSNVVLKFSTQDESWSVHTYGNTLTNSVFANYTITSVSSSTSIKKPVTITRVTTTNTVAATAHGYSNGDYITIAGANQSNYNGTFKIQNVSANAFDYIVTNTGTTPATGTITANLVSGRQMLVADAQSNVQIYNADTTDNGTAIGFDWQSQEIDFGDRSHTKSITNNLTVLTKYGLDSSLQVRIEDNDFQSVIKTLNDRVNIARNVNFRGRWFTFRWLGISIQKAPILEGILAESVNDEGLVDK